MDITSSKGKSITIIGAGLTGTLLAILFAKRGFDVHVYEQRADIRQVIRAYGRSIHLTIGERGWSAMRLAGVDEEIRKITIPLYNRLFHRIDGTNVKQPYGNEEEAIYSVCRAELNKALLNIGERYENISFHFHKRLIDIDLNGTTISLKDTLNGEVEEINPAFVIGADGAHSALRMLMQKTFLFNYSQSYISYGYQEITIDRNAEGDFLFDPNAFHIWARDQFLLVASPDPDKTFTATLFMPFKGENSFESLTDKGKIHAFFQKHFPDAYPYMSKLEKQMTGDGPYSMVTIKCNPWSHGNRFLLVGDAAHAIPPFYGQGMNSGMEDCATLIRLVDEHGDDWGKIITLYQEARIPNVDALSELTMRNFDELRSHVLDERRFLLKKQIERHLTNLYPQQWEAVYGMVAFSNRPYADALKMTILKEKILRIIMAIPDIHEKWETLDYSEYIELGCNPAVM